MSSNASPKSRPPWSRAMQRACLFLLAVLGVGGCPAREPFACVENLQCDGGAGGRCHAGGVCSYDDDTCESGRRYSHNAGAIADACVEPEDGVALACGERPVEDGTVLAELAAALEPGEWALMAEGRADLQAALRSVDGMSSVLSNNGEAKWNPTTGEVYVVGGDGGGGQRLVRYDAATDTWSGSVVPEFGSQGDPGESYALVALDVPGQRLFFANIEYDIATGVATERPTLPDQLFANDTYEYFPGLGLVGFIYGQLSVLPDGRDFWQPSTTVGAGGNLFSSAVYHPRLGRLLFGGGEDAERQLWLLDGEEVITALDPAPLSAPIGSAGETRARMVIDPRSDAFFFIDSDLSLWTLSVDTPGGAWTQAVPDISTQVPSLRQVVAAAIPTYGVLMVIVAGTPDQVWIYRHC